MNDDLTKLFIELEKNNDREKIGTILEDKLKHDPENVDLLFRMAMLNIYLPFADYPACCLFLEKVIAVSKKHKTIATLIIDGLKDRELGYILKYAILWLYEGKDYNLVDDLVKPLIEKIRETSSCDNISAEAKELVDAKLQCNANDVEALFLLATIKINSPKFDRDNIIKILDKIVTISEKNEAIALVFCAYIRNLSYIQESLLNRLKSLHTDNDEINSMIKYAISWFYSEQHNEELEERYLKESIGLYQGYVWNYENLAKLYQRQGRENEANILIQKAQSNVKKIYGYGNRQVDPTSLDVLWNELITGIYRT